MHGSWLDPTRREQPVLVTTWLPLRSCAPHAPRRLPFVDYQSVHDWVSPSARAAARSPGRALCHARRLDDQPFGTLVRTLRQRLGWRQADVAAKARLSQATVSRLERGHVASLSVASVRRVAAALDVRVDLLPLWRGGEIDRILSGRHSAMHDSVARRFAAAWTLAPEVSFSIYGERGVSRHRRLASSSTRAPARRAQDRPHRHQPAPLDDGSPPTPRANDRGGARLGSRDDLRLVDRGEHEDEPPSGRGSSVDAGDGAAATPRAGRAVAAGSNRFDRDPCRSGPHRVVGAGQSAESAPGDPPRALARTRRTRTNHGSLSRMRRWAVSGSSGPLSRSCWPAP